MAFEQALEDAKKLIENANNTQELEKANDTVSDVLQAMRSADKPDYVAIQKYEVEFTKLHQESISRIMASKSADAAKAAADAANIRLNEREGDLITKVFIKDLHRISTMAAKDNATPENIETAKQQLLSAYEKVDNPKKLSAVIEAESHVRNALYSLGRHNEVEDPKNGLNVVCNELYIKAMEKIHPKSNDEIFNETLNNLTKNIKNVKSLDSIDRIINAYMDGNKHNFSVEQTDQLSEIISNKMDQLRAKDAYHYIHKLERAIASNDPKLFAQMKQTQSKVTTHISTLSASDEDSPNIKICERLERRLNEVMVNAHEHVQANRAQYNSKTDPSREPRTLATEQDVEQVFKEAPKGKDSASTEVSPEASPDNSPRTNKLG